MRAVDTNVLVRLIARDDPAQVTAAEAFVDRGAWVSNVALVETVWVLASVYGRSAKEIVAIIERLLQHTSVSLQDPDVVGAALEHFRKRPSLGFSDCMMLEIARKAGRTPVGTFDRNMAKLPDTVRL